MTRRLHLGRHIYGLAAISFGLISLVWHDFGAPWQHIRALGDVSHPEILVYIAAALELCGGLAIQWRKTARWGALALAAIFLVWALMWVPNIIAEPRVYDRWGNFFEQLSIVSGALIIYATSSRMDLIGHATSGTKEELEIGRTSSREPRASSAGRPASNPTLARVGYITFTICVISFTLEQLFYLRATATFVPKWIPPGPMFWAVMTTIAFALAAIALLAGRFALLASRLLTIMILGFQFLVWLPAPFAEPHKLISWAGNAQNLAIAGAAWILADYLADSAEFPSPIHQAAH